MAKGKDFNLAGQGSSFLPTEERTQEILESMSGQELKTQRRRVNPGKMWRVNLLLDADLQEPVTIQALREGKNVSIFVNDLVKAYIAEHYGK